MGNTKADYWDVEGTSLHTYAWNVDTLPDDILPSRRGENIVVPRVHGEIWRSKKWDARIFTMGGWISNADTDGGKAATADGRLTRLNRNIQTLKNLFGATVLQTLTRRVQQPINEVQNVHNDATGGTFTLTFEGQTTAAIAYNASAATVESALEGLSNIDDVTVTGSGTAASPWVVTFVGASTGGRNVTQMTANDTGLTGHTTGTTISTVRAGNTSGLMAYTAEVEFFDFRVAYGDGDRQSVRFTVDVHMPDPYWYDSQSVQTL